MIVRRGWVHIIYSLRTSVQSLQNALEANLRYNSSMDRLELHLLGAPRLEKDGVEVVMDTRKALALLAYLAVSGQELPRDVLADFFWPDNDQAGARGALRRTLSTLNKAMGGLGLAINRERIGLDPKAGLWVDVAQFRSLVSGCRQHAPRPVLDCHDCMDNLEQAASFYQADFMTGFSLRDSPAFDEWHYLQSEALRGELACLLENLANSFASRGKYDTAIEYARRWVGLDSLREDAHRLLMTLYTHAGQRSAALQQYREVVRILDQELGVTPLSETTVLYQDILNGKLSPQIKLSQASTGLLSLPMAEAAPASLPPLVGRAHEWSALVEAYRKISARKRPAPGGWFVVIEGEAGIGKTRLAEDFLAYVRTQGGTVLQARSYEGEGSLAYAPFSQVLNAALQAGLAGKIKDLPASLLL